MKEIKKLNTYDNGNFTLNVNEKYSIYNSWAVDKDDLWFNNCELVSIVEEEPVLLTFKKENQEIICIDSDFLSEFVNINNVNEKKRYYIILPKKIIAGSIVKFLSSQNNEKRGYFRVTSIKGAKANLGSIFGKTIYFKQIPLETLIECENEWYSKWQESETYKSM